MRIKSGLLIAGGFAALLLVLYCSKDTSSPYEITSSKFGLVFKSSSGAVSDSAITDTVGRTDSIGVTIYLPNYFDSISISVRKENGDLESSILIKVANVHNDTTWIPLTFVSAGKKTVTATAYRTDHSQLADAGTIMIFGKTITINTRPSDETVNENGTASFTVKVSGDAPLVYQWFKDSAKVGGDSATLSINPVTLNSQGQYSCRIIDKWGDMITVGPFKLTVTQNTVVNHKPQWKHNTIPSEVKENAVLEIPLTDSCTDPDNDAVTFSLITGTPPGDTLINGNTYRFSPSYGDSGTYSVKIVGSDTKLSDTLLLNLHVSNVNRKPVFATDTPKPSYKIDANGLLSFNVLATDPDKDSVSYSILYAETSLPRKTDCTITGQTVSWKSQPGDSGNYVIVVAATDWKDTTRTQIQISIGKVNSPPVISIAGVSRNQTLTVKEGDSLKFFVKVTDLDSAAGDMVMLRLIDKTAFACAAKFSFDSISGAFMFVPSFACVKKDSLLAPDVKFIAMDNGIKGTLPSLSDTFSLKIMVNNYNSAPIAFNSSDSTNRNTPKTITLSASDPEGDSLSAWHIVIGPFHGTASSSTSQSFTYTPAANYSGPDSLIFQVSDGTLNSNVATLRIKVINVLVKPKISTQPVDQTVAKGPSGPSIAFGVKINSDVNPAPSYSWYKQNSSAPLSTDSVLKIDTVKYTSAGKYRIIVSNSEGADTSTWATLTVNDTTPPVITLKGASDTSILLNSSWTDPGAAASDDRIGDISVQLQKKDSVNVLAVGKYTVIYTVSDGSNTSSIKRIVRVNGWICIDSSISAGYFQIKMDQQKNLYIAYANTDFTTIGLSKLISNTWVTAGSSIKIPNKVIDMSFTLSPGGIPIIGYTTIQSSLDTFLIINQLANDIWQENHFYTSHPGYLDISSFSDTSILVVVSNAVFRKKNFSYILDTLYTISSDVGPNYLGLEKNNLKDCHVMAFASNSVYLAYKYYPSVVVKKYTGTTWIPAAADSICYSPSFYSTIQMASANNRIFLADGVGIYLQQPTVLELTGNTWTSLGTPYPDDAYSFSLTTSPDGIPFVAHSVSSSSKSIFVKKLAGTNWVGVPEPGTGLVATETLNLLCLQVADNISYLAGQGENKKVYVYKYERQ